jgi:hypothetical protein
VVPAMGGDAQARGPPPAMGAAAPSWLRANVAPSRGADSVLDHVLELYCDFVIHSCCEKCAFVLGNL